MRGFTRVTAFLLLSISLAAHQDLQEQIAAVSRRIQREPTNAELYLKRGELHRALRNWDLALADYDHAAQYSSKLAVVDLARGETLLQAGRSELAKAALDRFLARLPDHPLGLIARARAYAKLGRNDGAVEDYTRALAKFPSPRPEYYLERAQAQVALSHPDDALRGVDEGIAKLGPLVTLELFAIDLELGKKRYDAALSRLDRVAAQEARKEFCLERRGRILESAGRRAEARTAYQHALAAVESLPPARRNVRGTADLEKRLRKALSRS